MSTLTIDATTPSATVNLAVLNSLLDKLLDKVKRNELVLGKDEFLLINELRHMTTDGTGSTSVSSQIVITYT